MSSTSKIAELASAGTSVSSTSPPRTAVRIRTERCAHRHTEFSAHGAKWVTRARIYWTKQQTLTHFATRVQFSKNRKFASADHFRCGMKRAKNGVVTDASEE